MKFQLLVAFFILTVLSNISLAYAQVGEDADVAVLDTVCAGPYRIFTSGPSTHEIANLETTPIPESFEKAIGRDRCGRYDNLRTRLIDMHRNFGTEASMRTALDAIVLGPAGRELSSRETAQLYLTGAISFQSEDMIDTAAAYYADVSENSDWQAGSAKPEDWLADDILVQKAIITRAPQDINGAWVRLIQQYDPSLDEYLAQHIPDYCLSGDLGANAPEQSASCRAIFANKYNAYYYWHRVHTLEILMASKPKRYVQISGFGPFHIAPKDWEAPEGTSVVSSAIDPVAPLTKAAIRIMLAGHQNTPTLNKYGGLRSINIGSLDRIRAEADLKMLTTARPPPTEILGENILRLIPPSCSFALAILYQGRHIAPEPHASPSQWRPFAEHFIRLHKECSEREVAGTTLHLANIADHKRYQAYLEHTLAGLDQDILTNR